jgi:hypothetical protein
MQAKPDCCRQLASTRLSLWGLQSAHLYCKQEAHSGQPALSRLLTSAAAGRGPAQGCPRVRRQRRAAIVARLASSVLLACRACPPLLLPGGSQQCPAQGCPRERRQRQGAIAARHARSRALVPALHGYCRQRAIARRSPCGMLSALSEHSDHNQADIMMCCAARALAPALPCCCQQRASRGRPRCVQPLTHSYPRLD